MSIRIVLFITVCVFYNLGSVRAQDDTCVGCICEAASKCNLTVGCRGGMCGMFGITLPYWTDAGKPTIPGDKPNAPDAWVRCVTDPFCAATTLRGYMAKFKTDCNGDGEINCFDFASIHHLGGYGCGSRPLDSQYLAQFNECIAGSIAVGGST